MAPSSCGPCSAGGACRACDTVSQVVNPDGSTTITITQTDGTSATWTAGLPDLDYAIEPGPGANEYTVTRPDGSTYVVSTFDEDFTANADGSFTFTDDDGSVVVIPAPTYSSFSAIDNGNGTTTITHTSGDGVIVSATLCSTCTTAEVDPATGVVTINNPDGTTVDITPSAFTFVSNADGSITITHTAGNGDVVTGTIPAPTFSSIEVVGSTITHTSGDGVVTPIDICALIAANCSDSMTINPDGSVTHTAIDGTEVVIPPVTPSSFAFVENPNGSITITHTSGDGTEVVGIIPAPPAPSSFSFVENPDGSIDISHDDGAGTVEGGTIPAPVSSQFTFTDNGDATYTITHTGSDGVTTSGVIDVNEIDMDINSVTQAGSVLTFTAEDGTTVNVDVCAIVAGNCDATLVANPDGSFTHTSNSGATTIIPAPAAGSTSTLTDGVNEFTHTDGNGGSTTVPQATVVVDNTYIGTVTDSEGVTDTFISQLDVCDGNGGTVQLDPATQQLVRADLQIGQAIVDHEGGRLQEGCNDIELHRSLVIGQDHVAGATGVGDPKFIGSSHSDSDDVDTGVVTTHHTRAVIASNTSRASQQDSVVVGSLSSEANSRFGGVYSSTGSDTAGGSRNAVIGGRDSISQGDTAVIAGSHVAENTADALYGFIGASFDATNAANWGSLLSVRIGSISADTNVAMLGAVLRSSIDSSGTAAIIASQDGTVSGALNSGLFADAESTITGASNTTASVASQRTTLTDTDKTAVVAGADATVTGSTNAAVLASVNSVIDIATRRVAILASSDGTIAANTTDSAIVSGFQGFVSDDAAISLSGGHANVGTAETFAHGTPTGGAASNQTAVGFRGVVPQPARVVATLADVILALQEQGLAL